MIKEEGGDYNFTGASPANWQERERERRVEQIKQTAIPIFSSYTNFSPRNTNLFSAAPIFSSYTNFSPRNTNFFSALPIFSTAIPILLRAIPITGNIENIFEPISILANQYRFQYQLTGRRKRVEQIKEEQAAIPIFSTAIPILLHAMYTNNWLQ